VADTLFHVLTGFFARYGYWVVFFGVMLENAGIPVPGETVLIFAGFLAFHQKLDLGRAVATAVLGATVGDSLGYALGRFGGVALVDRYRRRAPFLFRRFDRAQRLFAKHGQWAVFIGRFITGLRVFAGILAGLFEMPYWRFLFFNFTGAVSWAATFGCVGYVFGSNWERLAGLLRDFDRVTLGLIAAAVVVASAVWLVRRRRL
jgi:membrane protein DedA with SNARE-associated domain